MIISPYSYNGTVINDGVTYNAWVERAQSVGAPPSRASYVSRPGAYPILSGKEFLPTSLTIKIEVIGDPSGWMAGFETLNTLFDFENEVPRQFIVKDTSDSDTQYFVYCLPEGQPVFGDDGAIYQIRLAFDDPIWQGVDLQSSTFDVTSATDTLAITIGGNADAFPSFEITPSSSGAYNRYIQMIPQSTYPWPARPLCLTGATDTTFDTAALIAGGKMEASSDPGGEGGDIRVYRGADELDFWVEGINSTDTKIWVTADITPRHNMTLKTAIGSTDTVSKIVLTYNTTNKTEITALPKTGRLIIDSALGSTDTEEFTYTNKTITGSELSFTAEARAARGTTAVAHAAGAFVRYLPYDFNITYGNKTLPAADVQDDYKPVLNLATSTNQSFVWLYFYEDAALRSGILMPLVKKVSYPSLTRSDVFTSTGDAGDVSPATEAGMKALTYQNDGVWRADTVEIVWDGYFPDGVTSVTTAGEQTQNVASAPSFVLLAKKTATQTTPTTLFTLAAQSATDYGTFTAWSKATTDMVTVPAGVLYLQFSLKGQIAATGAGDNYKKVGVDALTVNLTNAPHIMIRDETSSSAIDFTLTNEYSESMRIVFPLAPNEMLEIDTDPDFPTATYKGEIVNGAIKLNETRPAWLRLPPGSTTIGFDNDLSAANIKITAYWRNRKVFL